MNEPVCVGCNGFGVVVIQDPDGAPDFAECLECAGGMGVPGSAEDHLAIPLKKTRKNKRQEVA